jgi:hypothetical protein
MKPHTKLAYLLMFAGKGLFLLEASGLGLLRQSGVAIHLGSALFGLLLLTPAALLLAGCVVFVVGGIRRAR